MASQEFCVEDVRYVPGPVVRYNITKGRFWDHRRLRDGCWVQERRTFPPIRATRNDILGRG